jgi:2-aminoethylphosphonate-pyruvate transaminase
MISRTSNIDLVVFDMAGTTVHDGDAVNDSLRGALQVIAKCTVTRDQVNLVMGIQKPVAIRSLLSDCTDKAPSEELVDRVHDDFVSRMLNYYKTSPAVREVDGVSNLFKTLKSMGIKVGIDTGFNRAIAQVIIDRLGWEKDGLVDVSVTADEVLGGRPAPFMIYHCMEKVGVTKVARVVKVGDTPSDLYEGTNAGCGLVVGVTEGSHTAAEMQPHPHTHLIPTVADLPRVLIESKSITDPTRLRLFTPGPLNTSATVKRAMLRDIGAWDDELIQITREIRTSIQDLAGLTKADGFESVLMQGSGTFGVESVVSSLVPPGGRLLVAVNGAYGERIAIIAKKLGIDTTVLQCDERQPIRASAVTDAIQAGKGFDVVAVVHCETTTGLLNPIHEIGNAVKKLGCRLIVDAMSSFGGIEIDWRGVGVDALVSSSNKCIEGVPGFSFAIIRRDWLESAKGHARSLSLDVVEQWYGFETHGRFRFTPPTHVLRAFQQALRELKDEGGVTARESRYRANHRTLIAGMTAMGFGMAIDPIHQSHFITTFLEPDKFEFTTFYKALRDRGLIIYAGKLTATKCFRIGNIGRLYQTDINDLLLAIGQVLEEQGITNHRAKHRAAHIEAKATVGTEPACAV